MLPVRPSGGTRSCRSGVLTEQRAGLEGKATRPRSGRRAPWGEHRRRTRSQVADLRDFQLREIKSARLQRQQHTLPPTPTTLLLPGWDFCSQWLSGRLFYFF